MKQLVKMSNEKLLPIILKSETLSRLLDNTLVEHEESYILDDRLPCFERGAINYELGVCNPGNYMSVRDEDKTTEGVAESVRCFGGSERLEKLLNQTRKLYNTNLYSYYVGKLLEAYYEDEIKPTYDFLEDMGSAIYNKDEQTLKDIDIDQYLDWMRDSGMLEGYFVGKDGGLYETRKVS